jgi:hypothetical protein
MGHIFFFLALVAACLLFSAAATAAAARSRGAARVVLEAAAILVPVLVLLALLSLASMLAFGPRPLARHWFGPVLFAALSGIIGGVWIARAGLYSASPGGPPAAHWPVIGLAGLCAAAASVAFGTLAAIDNAVAAQAPYLRLEAAQLMATHLPPPVAEADNAATAYRVAFATLDEDAALDAEGSPLASPNTADVTVPATAALLARHRGTLDAIRRAADRENCRFARDWTRPSVDMELPELASMRRAARLLALEARREAAEGDAAAALADVVRIARIGRHAAGEPVLVCGLVGLAIDRLALDTLAAVLPRLTKADRRLLDDPALAEMVARGPEMTAAFYGEEAFGLSMLADVADGRSDLATIAGYSGGEPADRTSPLIAPLSSLFRTFLLPADIAAYRGMMERLQKLAESGKPFAAIRDELAAIDTAVNGEHPGVMSGLLVPPIGGVLGSMEESRARHAAARAAVAATQHRLDTGRLPATLGELVPQAIAAVPADPFTADRPLTLRAEGNGWVVYSVGRDGADDGGPQRPGPDKPGESDDVGLWLAL